MALKVSKEHRGSDKCGRKHALLKILTEGNRFVYARREKDKKDKTACLPSAVVRTILIVPHDSGGECKKSALNCRRENSS